MSRKTMQFAIYGMTLVLCLAQIPTPVVSQQGTEELTAGTVDFRMTSLEQAKKIAGQVRARQGAGVTMTIMSGWHGETEDREHLIVGPAAPTPEYLRARLLNGRFASVSWSTHPAIRPLGSCDSEGDCEEKTDEMCKDAGHGGVDGTSVEVATHVDGSKTCSGDCKEGGAVAFVTCNPS